MALMPQAVVPNKGLLKLLRETVPLEPRGLEIYRSLLTINELATRLNGAEDLQELKACLGSAFQSWMPRESLYFCMKDGPSLHRSWLAGPQVCEREEILPLESSLAETVIKTGAPLWIRDVSRSGAWIRRVAADRPQPGSVIVLPCQAMGQIVSVLQIESGCANRFDKIDYHLASLVASHLSSSLQNILTRQQLSVANEQLRQRDARLRQLNQRLKELAHRDETTGLYNKRRLMEQLDCELARCRRYGGALSCLMLDIDYFKRINDTLGHQAGDQVLRRLAELVRGRLRVTDFVARYGGEEFTILLPNTGAAGAATAAEDVRESISMESFAFANVDVKLTVSIGVSSYTAFDGIDAHQVILAADSALYRAKREGRNRVCVEEADEPENVKILAIG